MRKINLNFLRRVAVACLLFVAASVSAVADDFDVFMERIRADFMKNPTEASIGKVMKLYNDADGSFTDIDYRRDDRTNWPPQRHLERLEQFVAAYTNPENHFYGNDDLYGRIVKSLQYWQDVNPNCNNWWYNQIAEPQSLGVMLIQMRAAKKHVPAELEKAILERMVKEGGDPAKWTGANRTDICLHWIYRSCLERNDRDMQKAMQLVFDPIRYTTKEGFQHDNCYFQHGVQLYIGGYGDEILKGITQVGMYAYGTKYALPDDKVQLVSKFMRGTYYQTIRGKYMLYDVMGRSVSRPNILDKGDKALFAERMIQLDPKHADEFRLIVQRMRGEVSPRTGISPLHTHYFRGDYTLHVRPGYIFDVRLVSDRTSRLEYGNNENLKTYFVSDGCNSLVKRGGEYYNIFPTWNWTRIPGTTVPQMNPIPMAKSDWQQRGTSKFAGGVSDSVYGATAYVYDDLWDGIDTHAKKAWFFFDDEIVCLGSGITSGNANPVVTTLNQTLALDGRQFRVIAGKGAGASSDNASGTNIKAVEYGGVGYVFPQGGNVEAQVATQSGTWYDINRSHSKDMQQNDVFTVSLNHGVKPHDATYAYIVVPEAQGKDLAAYARRHVSILSNTPSLQAVQQTELGVWQFIFYEPGTYKDKNVTVVADKPCAVMLRRMADGSVSLHVADPAQKQQPVSVGVKVKGAVRKLVTSRFDFTGTGVYAGATKAVVLNAKGQDGRRFHILSK